MEELIWEVIKILAGPILTAIALYFGMIRGTGKTVDVALVKIEKRMKESPTAQRLSKSLELVDKLFGDDEAVENIKGLIKDARELVGSPEAKNFFKNVTMLIEQLGGEPEKKPLLNIPEKP